MKKKFINILVICFLSLQLYAQKNDNTWIFGYHYSYNMQVCGLDFYYGPPDTVGFNPPFNFVGTSDACMSNDNGDLLFYSNGSSIANYNNTLFPNSTGFNTDGPYFYNEYWQGVLPFKYPDHPNQYVVTHLCGVYYSNNSKLNAMKLFYSVIDMSVNNGLGDIILKNQVAFEDTLLPCIMSATRHANGRDWWIINHKGYSNVFYVSLLTPDGIVQNTAFPTGPELSYFTYSEGQSIFSPDGSKFAISYNTNNSVYLFDFDRCNGVINYKDSVNIIPTDSSEWPVWGCSFSPNSRFLYATTNNDLYQYDTWATTLNSGTVHIADFDGFQDPFENYFFRHALGPDGKIYILTWGSSHFLHVINDPDQPDTSCNFVQHQLQLINYDCGTLPDFPNYRLGAVSGSICDSLTGISEGYQTAKYDVSIFPNPNYGTFKISYQLPDANPGVLKVINLYGEVVFLERLPQFSIQQVLDLKALKSGIYEIYIEDGNFRRNTRFVKLEE